MSSPDDDLLQFKDYSNTPSTSSPPPAQISVNSPDRSGRQRGDPLSDLIYDMTNAASNPNTGNMNTGGGGGIGGGAGDEPNNNKLSFLTIEYYQQFFNVDTFMVLDRIANSIIPKRAGVDYLRQVITPNPDLYGPFWITITLIFSIAITGNIASYLHYASDDYHWQYNFRLVSYAATCIFLYANCFPAMLWGLFKYSLKPVEDDLETQTQSAGYTPSLLALMCVYGYSLAIYIPVSILWVIPIYFVQWLLVISATLLSGMVLIMTLTPALRNSKLSLFLMIGILGAHFLLAAGFMLYFFHGPDQPDAHSANLKLPTNPVAHAQPTVANLVKHAIAGDIVPRNVTA